MPYVCPIIIHYYLFEKHNKKFEERVNFEVNTTGAEFLNMEEVG
jgi:hypothetical protein